MGFPCQLHKSRRFAAAQGPKWEWTQMVNLNDVFLLSTTAPVLLLPSRGPQSPAKTLGQRSHGTTPPEMLTSREIPRLPWQSTGPRRPSGDRKGMQDLLTRAGPHPRTYRGSVILDTGCVRAPEHPQPRGALSAGSKQSQAAPPSPSTTGRGCSALLTMSVRVCATPSLNGVLLLRWLHPCSCGHQRGRRGAGSISRLLEAAPRGTWGQHSGMR